MEKDSLEYLASLPWDFENRDIKAKYFEQVCSMAIGEEYFGWAEFGIGTGKTARLLMQHKGNRWLHLFDSFKGIPEPWKFSDDCTMKTGTSEHKFPNDVIFGGRIAVYPGMFAETVPAWAEDQTVQVGLVHIDCDIYSSARDVLTNIAGILGRGTIIMFDEYFNYPNYAENEYKAFMELVKDRSLKFEYIARSDVQAAIRIL